MEQEKITNNDEVSDRDLEAAMIGDEAGEGAKKESAEQSESREFKPGIEDAQIVKLKEVDPMRSYEAAESVLNGAASLDDWKERLEHIKGIKGTSREEPYSPEELKKLAETGEVGANFLPRNIRKRFKELSEIEKLKKSL